MCPAVGLKAGCFTFRVETGNPSGALAATGILNWWAQRSRSRFIHLSLSVECGFRIAVNDG